MKREKCMYGFQFRIFMRSRHSGGPRRVRQQGGEGRPERILCYASIEKWADQESVGGPEGAGPAVYMSNLHFQYFLLGRKHQLSSLPSRHSPCSVWNGIARLQDYEERLLEFFFWNSHTLSGNLHSIFRNLGSAGSTLFLSSLPRYARPTERDIFQEIISAM